MQGNPDAHLVHELEHGEILHEDGVGLDVLQVGEIFFQRRDFLVADEIIQRDVEPHVMRVAIVDGLFQLLVGEIEIAFVHAHVEMLAAEIDRVRARLHIRDQRVPRPSRSQELDRFPRQNHKKENLFSSIYFVYQV